MGQSRKIVTKTNIARRYHHRYNEILDLDYTYLLENTLFIWNLFKAKEPRRAPYNFGHLDGVALERIQKPGCWFIILLNVFLVWPVCNSQSLQTNVGTFLHRPQALLVFY